MDLHPKELKFLTIPQILQESISIKKQSPRTFNLITLTFIFPLSLAILAYSFFTQPILAKYGTTDSYRSQHDWTLLFIFQFCYIIFFFTFSLLSTAAIVFTVASLYTGKPVTFSSTMAAMPKLFKRLSITFLWALLLVFIYNAVFFIFLFILFFFLIILFISLDLRINTLFIAAAVLIFVLCSGVHVYFTALCNLGSVVSVLEPVYGFAALKKAYELLKGKTKMGMVLLFLNLILCAVIGGVFGAIVVNGGGKYAVSTRTLVGGLLLGVLVMVNLMGFLIQSVFYYVCKSYHDQTIDKSALYDHLGGYLGEYAPLKSVISIGEFRPLNNQV